MRFFKIEKSKMVGLAKRLSETHAVFIPARADQGYLRFCKLDFRSEKQNVESIETLSFWGYRNTIIPPKEVFFPQTEVLFTFSEQMPELSVAIQPLPTVILGIRPCDARAINFLDKVFINKDTQANIENGAGNFNDPYYAEKRGRSVIISLACNNPQSTCFCTSLGGSPDGEAGADIILFDLHENLIARPVSKKGEEFIGEFRDWFKEPGEKELNKKNELVAASRDRMRPIEGILNAEAKLDNLFADFLWNEIHMKCLGCGICTYLCPTCHCFDITDEVRNKRGRRLRCWDSCMFPSFTLHASGHNPRPTYRERMRQRIMHKFNYCPKNFREIFCVGCGRCVRNCPVNLDIREIICRILETKNAK